MDNSTWKPKPMQDRRRPEYQRVCYQCKQPFTTSLPAMGRCVLCRD